MKRIDIVRYTTEDKIYAVYLGNGTRHLFTRERDAKQFLVETSNFLTDHMYMLHDLFIMCWNTYQVNWSYFRHNKPHTYNMLECDRRASASLLNIQNSLNIAVERCGHTNGNHFAFTHMMAICNSLREVVKILQLVNDKKSNRRQLYSLENIYEQLNQIHNALQNYSTAQAEQLFKLPADLNDNIEFELTQQLRAA